MTSAPPRDQRRPWVRSDATGRGRRWPVVLVHGYTGTDAVWDPLAHELCASGFGHVVRLSYDSFRTDPADVVRALREQVAAALDVTGARGVHLVGHSLGGLFVRRAVTGGPGAVGPATVVMIATPQLGVRLARWLPGPCARMLAPARSAVPASDREHPAVRWITFSSDRDRCVPPSSARLPEYDPGVTNVHVPGRGHLTICRDPRLIARVVLELARSERSAVGAVALAA